MQLKPTRDPRSLRAGLALAAASLLGARASAAAEDVEVGSGLLVYAEPGRVTALEAVVLASRGFWETHKVQLRLVLDALTGASPNGAVPSRQVQTFTTPSGSSGYETKAGVTPLDDTFKDTRFALSLNHDRPFLSSGHWNVGIQGSAETDYFSIGGSTGITQEFFHKNTALSLGVSGSHDSISPVGGVPTPFTEMPPPTGDGGHDDFAGGSDFTRGDDGYGENTGEGSGDSKVVFDGIVGVTQVINRRMLARFNYSISVSNGYLNDPYKLLSVLYGPGDPLAGDPVTYIYENRPDTRTKHSVFAETKLRLATTTLGLSYRYLWDSWGVTSHTGELKERIPMGETFYLEPHLRLYEQTAADFHTTYLISGEPLPAHASADPRLGAMTAFTVGNRFGGFHVGHQEFALSFEYYRQILKDGKQQAFGSLAGLDLSEDMDAIMFRISHDWEP